tara:strand:+ start:2203 stop:2838 length:636 start_codon:yes stop_codon:yes gene_type:complete
MKFLSVFLLALSVCGVFAPAYAQDFLDTLEAEILQQEAEQQAQQPAPQNQTQPSETPPQSVAPPEAGMDDADIPDAYIQEAETFYQYCEYSDTLRAHHDCECLAAQFLDKRIANGIQATRKSIMAKIDRECIDASEEAFNQYTQCKSNTLLLPKKVDAETYCTCFGNEYAKIFELKKYEANAKNAVRAQTGAHSNCARGTYAQDNYGPGAQ